MIVTIPVPGDAKPAPLHRWRGKAVDNGGRRYGATESALRPPLPTATPPPLQAAPGSQNRTVLTDPAKTNIFISDPRKQTSGGRHQIGTPAGFKSESVAGFKSESLAGFVGIRRS